MSTADPLGRSVVDGGDMSVAVSGLLSVAVCATAVSSIVIPPLGCGLGSPRRYTRADDVVPLTAAAAVHSVAPVVLLLFVLGIEGAAFLNVAGTLEVVADDVSAVALYRRHGGPASRDIF